MGERLGPRSRDGRRRTSSACATSIVRLFALALPVLGVALIVQRLVHLDGQEGVGLERRAAAAPGARARRRPPRLVGAARLGLVAVRPVPARAPDRQRHARRRLPAPSSAAGRGRAPGRRAPRRRALAPGRHLAVALIPRGGPTEEHPALYVVNGGDEDDKPTILVSPDAPDARKAPTLDGPPAARRRRRPRPTPRRRRAAGRLVRRAATTGPATQLPFKLPDKPGEGDSQALATNTTDGGIIYDVAYSLVTVKDGDPVDERELRLRARQLQGLHDLAVSFQLVLVVGQSDKIMPINVAEALNLNCPSCITTAIAKQIVVSVKSAPSEELLRRLTEELKKLDAIDTSDPPAEVLEQVNAVSDAINKALDESGITYPKARRHADSRRRPRTRPPRRRRARPRRPRRPRRRRPRPPGRRHRRRPRPRRRHRPRRRPRRRPRFRAVPYVEPEADLQRRLVVGHLAVGDVAADRDDLEPVDVAHGLGGLRDGAVDRRRHPAGEDPVISTDL